MNALRLILAALVCSAPLLAAGQWQWVDKDGRRVFSDAPPPADVPPSRILKQPGQRTRVGVEEAVATPAPAAAPVPKVSGVDKDLEAKKKQAEAAKAEAQKAEDQRIAQARADNCERARRAKTAFDSGQRVIRTNAQGEREYLDDKQRDAEVKRLDAIIARDCK